MFVTVGKVGENMCIDKTRFIMNYIGSELPVIIEKVLYDSSTDPQYSAVYTNNLIKAYIELSKNNELVIPYSDVKDYFDFSGFTLEEYEEFENKRKREAEYYIGEQY